MARRAFLAVTDWPTNELSEVGRLTASFTGEAEDHMGLLVPFCTAQEIAAHSEPSVCEPSAKGAPHVSFDFMSNLMPRFQSIRNTHYFTPSSQTNFYPILVAPADAIHQVCMDVATADPRNYCVHRLNYIFWCWPFACCCCPAQRQVAPSTCVALSARIIAAAATGETRRAFRSDHFVADSLGVPRFSLSTPRAPYFLTGYTPKGGVEALRSAGVLGEPVGSANEALELCLRSPCIGIAPLAPVQTRKSLGRALPLVALRTHSDSA